MYSLKSESQNTKEHQSGKNIIRLGIAVENQKI